MYYRSFLGSCVTLEYGLVFLHSLQTNFTCGPQDGFFFLPRKTDVDLPVVRYLVAPNFLFFSAHILYILYCTLWQYTVKRQSN
jgi:hypothetical protein